jgi:hypothetical protein
MPVLVLLLTLLLAVLVASAGRMLAVSAHVSALEHHTALERAVAEHLTNRLDAVFVRLTTYLSILIAPAALAMVVPMTTSWFAVVLYIVVLAVCADAFELVDHTNIHNHVFRASRGAPPVVRSALRMIELWQEYGLTLAMGRIPQRYRIQHIYAHHVENNGIVDPQSTMPYDRTSYLDFSRYALKMGINSTFPWDVTAYLFRRHRYRQLFALYANLLVYLGAIAVLSYCNVSAAVVFIVLRFSSGVGSALLNFYEHGLLDSSDPANIYRNASTVAARDDSHGALGSDFHIAHHAFPGRHWSELIAVARADDDRYRQEGTIVFRDTRGIVKNLLRRKFDLIASQCELNGRTLPELTRELRRRANTHLDDANAPNGRFVAWLGDIAARFLIAA